MTREGNAANMTDAEYEAAFQDWRKRHGGPPTTTVDGKGEGAMTAQLTLTAGQRCPTCGIVVLAPLHACHAIRDNYVVTLATPSGPIETWPRHMTIRQGWDQA